MSNDKNQQNRSTPREGQVLGKPDRDETMGSGAPIVKSDDVSTPAVKPAVGTPITQPIEQPEPQFNIDFAAMIARTKANPATSPLLLSTITFLEEYVVKMDPDNAKAPTGIPGADYQARFSKVLQDVINKSKPEEFQRAWNVVLSFFWRYRTGALSERYVHRYPEFWNKFDPSLVVFQKVTNLACISANPETRQNVTKSVSVPRSIQGKTAPHFQPQGAQNLLAYYKV